MKDELNKKTEEEILADIARFPHELPPQDYLVRIFVDVENRKLLGLLSDGNVITISGSGDPLREVYRFDNVSEFPVTGIDQTLYIDSTNGNIYMWNGTEYYLIASKSGDVLNFATVGDFPETGLENKLYVDNSTGDIYNYNGDSYNKINQSGSSVLNFPTFGDFPTTGEEDKIYIADDLKNCYIWDGTGYSQINGGSSDVLNFSTFGDFPATGLPNKLYIDDSTGDIYNYNGGNYNKINDGGGESSILNFPTFGDFPATGLPNKLYIDDSTGDIYNYNGGNYNKINGGGGESSVLNFPTFGDFPVTGEDDKIYIADDTKDIYIWNGTSYILINVPGTIDDENISLVKTWSSEKISSQFSEVRIRAVSNVTEFQSACEYFGSLSPRGGIILVTGSILITEPISVDLRDIIVFGSGSNIETQTSRYFKFQGDNAKLIISEFGDNLTDTIGGTIFKDITFIGESYDQRGNGHLCITRFTIGRQCNTIDFDNVHFRNITGTHKIVNSGWKYHPNLNYQVGDPQRYPEGEDIFIIENPLFEILQYAPNNTKPEYKIPRLHRIRLRDISVSHWYPGTGPHNSLGISFGLVGEYAKLTGAATNEVGTSLKIDVTGSNVNASTGDYQENALRIIISNKGLTYNNPQQIDTLTSLDACASFARPLVDFDPLTESRLKVVLKRLESYRSGGYGAKKWVNMGNPVIPYNVYDTPTISELGANQIRITMSRISDIPSDEGTQNKVFFMTLQDLKDWILS